MPRYTQRRRSRAMTGGSVISWLKKAAKTANRFLKKNKVISRGANFLGKVGFKHPAIGHVGRAAGSLGYGRKVKCSRRCYRRRRPVGGALSLAGGRRRRTGGALRLAGGRRRRAPIRRRRY